MQPGQPMPAMSMPNHPINKLKGRMQKKFLPKGKMTPAPAPAAPAARFGGPRMGGSMPMQFGR